MKPNETVPELDLPIIGGGRFKLGGANPESFYVLVFYRGLHCPVCKTHVHDLAERKTEFAAHGAIVAAVSTDTEDRAKQSYRDWRLNSLTVAYDLPIEQARSWGLYISAGIKEGEPPLFSEPGLFLIRPNQTLYAASVQSMPFARPHVSDVLDAIKFIREKDYPARGEA